MFNSKFNIDACFVDSMVTLERNLLAYQWLDGVWIF